jgi:hypothetical protein
MSLAMLLQLQSNFHQLTRVEPLTYKRKRDLYYNKYVISKIGKADNKKVVMNLGGYHLHEHMFVACFKPDGWMSNFVVSCLTNLWNKEWGDKTIISHLAVVSTIRVLSIFSMLCLVYPILPYVLFYCSKSC